MTAGSRIARPSISRIRVRSPADRADLINQQIYASISDETMVELRRLVLSEVWPRRLDYNEPAQLRAIFDWVRGHIAYFSDPIAFDFFPTAQLLLYMGGGDCDDHAILIGSLLAVSGFAVGLRVIQTAEGWHVYALAGLPLPDPREWLPMDTAWRHSQGPGDEYQGEIYQTLTYLLDLRAGRLT